MNLFEMTEAAKKLYAMLENDEIDEQTINDTLESMGAEEKLENYIYVEKTLEADLEAHRAEKERHEARIKSIQSNIKRLKDAILTYMKATGAQRAKAGTFELFIRTTKCVNIVDEAVIPAEYLRLQPPKIDKIAIKKAIERGETVEGAEITQNESVLAR